MTDLQITRLCADVMGINVVVQLGGLRLQNTQFEDSLYDPLHDDAQAMQLVKRFGLGIVQFHDKLWTVNDRKHTAQDADLNRAICKCVARMQS